MTTPKLPPEALLPRRVVASHGPPTNLYDTAVSKGLVDPIESLPFDQGSFPWDCWVRFINTPKGTPLFGVILAGIPVPVKWVASFVATKEGGMDGNTWEIQTTRLVRRGQTLLAPDCPLGSIVWVEKLRSYVVETKPSEGVPRV